MHNRPFLPHFSETFRGCTGFAPHACPVSQITKTKADLQSNGPTDVLRTVQGFAIWITPVACCMAIQGFWLGALQMLPMPGTQDLHDLHRFDARSAPKLMLSGGRPRA
jgi:hypothetical protein